jgi:hypothetical protein
MRDDVDAGRVADAADTRLRVAPVALAEATIAAAARRVRHRTQAS